jgi:uncharacterized protein YndB with AHSA1/START domain
MTKQKSFKLRVRARMEKTQERYSAARRQLLSKAASREDQSTEPTEEAPAPVDSGVEALKTSDAALRSRTGRAWSEWFARLDAWGATERKHPEIARWLSEEQGVDGWWAQSITVAYEQARGLRAPGQGADGTYTVSVGRTVAVSVERLFEAFDDLGLRERWLPGHKLDVSTSKAPKSFRAKWSDDGSRIAVGFTPKGENKSQVAIAHERLSSPEAAREMKAFWSERVRELKQILET